MILLCSDAPLDLRIKSNLIADLLSLAGVCFSLYLHTSLCVKYCLNSFSFVNPMTLLSQWTIISFVESFTKISIVNVTCIYICVHVNVYVA